jgi:hypothetical protein
VREVPDDGPESTQPVAPEHHLVALQGNDEEVNVEGLVVDGKREHRADPKAGQPLVVGHAHVHAILGHGSQVQVTFNLSRHEAMGGCKVDQGGECLVLHRDDQCHGLTRADARQGVEGDIRLVVVIGSVKVLVLACVKEADAPWGTP